MGLMTGESRSDKKATVSKERAKEHLAIARKMLRGEITAEDLPPLPKESMPVRKIVKQKPKQEREDYEYRYPYKD